jgi:hypothetical protein
MKQKIQFICSLKVLALALFVLGGIPAGAEALTSEQRASVVAQAKSQANALQDTASKGLVQCGNDDNIKNESLTKQNPPTGKCTLYDAFNTFIRIINALMLLAAVYAVIRIVMAGFMMVISGGNEERLSAGKTGLTNALLGFIIVLIAYLVINTILGFLVPGGNTILRNPLEFIN